MNIAGQPIGPGRRPFIVSELSANHNGSLDRALSILDASKHAGADACKVQVYLPIALAEARGGMSKVVENGPWAGRTLYDLYRQGETPFYWLPVLFNHAAKIGITLFASVFDEANVDILEKFGWFGAYKISSFELRNASLIRKAAVTGKPLILSTGMAEPHDISAAIQAASGTEFALLHCVSAYPCPLEKANLSRISKMRRIYGCPIGWSDHTLGSEAAIAATALGASIIEKHLTLSRADGGLDASFSMEPHEFAAMVKSVHATWDACQESDVLAPYKELRVNAA